MKKTFSPFFKSALLIATVVLSSNANAQQDPMYTQYRFNYLAVNPAYAGHEGHLTAVALARYQWVGFDGAPSTQNLTIHAPLKKENLGWGASIINDKVGPLSQTGIWGDISYKVKMTEHSDLSFGLKGGGSLFQIALSEIPVHDAGDVAFSQNLSLFLPNVGFGMLYEADKYYVGASFPRLLRNDLQNTDATIALQEEKRHFFLTGGYKHDLNETTVFEPTFMVRKVKNAPISMDLAANFILQDKVWLGAMYRFGDAFAITAQYKVKDQFRVGYAFDLTTSSLGQYNSGTHELMLRFDLVRAPSAPEEEPLDPSAP